MGSDYYNSKTLKICIIGGDKEIIEKIFPNELTLPKVVDDLYTTRRRHQNIEAKDYNTGNSSKYKINWEGYIFPNMNDDNEDTIMETILNNFSGYQKKIPMKKKKKKHQKIISSLNLALIISNVFLIT